MFKISHPFWFFVFSLSAGFISKMQVFQVISLTLLSVMAANAQVFVWGKCPQPAVQENFDASQVNLNSPISLLLLAFALFVCASIFFSLWEGDNKSNFYSLSIQIQSSFVNRIDDLQF